MGMTDDGKLCNAGDEGVGSGGISVKMIGEARGRFFGSAPAPRKIALISRQPRPCLPLVVRVRRLGRE